MAKTPKKKPTSSYWKRRFELLQDEALRPADEYLLDLGEIYERAAQELERKMLYWTKRFADNNDLTMAEAKKVLEAGELKEFHWTLEEYAKKAAQGSRWAREVENASARVHLSRLEAMRLDLKGVVEGAVPEDMRWLFEEIYERAYYGAGHEVACGFGTSFPMQKIDEKALDRVMRKPWTTDARTFSDRLWTNKSKLIGTLETKLAQGLMLGTSHDKLIRELRDEMRTSFANAQRIVRTESAFFSAAGDRDAYQSLGVEKFQILATLDTRTSEICQEMDLKIFDFKDYEIGVTAPPFHPNCRSTTVPYFDDMAEVGERAARDAKGNTVMVRGDMGYMKWKNVYINGYKYDEQAKAFITKEFTIPFDKVYKYLLKDGSPHIKEFQAVGFSKDNVDTLLDQLYNGFINGVRDYDRPNAFLDDFFRIEMSLGINEKRTFRTVWGSEKKGGKPRFISAYRHGKKNK